MIVVDSCGGHIMTETVPSTHPIPVMGGVVATEN